MSKLQTPFSPTRPTRRAFMGSATAAALLSPFLSPLLPWAGYPRRAGAAIPGKTKRLLLFCTMGTYPPIWKPTAVSGETITTFSACMKPLEAIRDHVVMIEGCPSGNPANGHGAPDSLTGLGYQFTGMSGMISVDQFISDRLIAGGINRPIPSLLLGANTNGETVFLRGNKLPTIGSPRAAFNTVFSGVMPAGMSTDKLMRRRRSILDLVKGEANTLRGRLGGEQRAKLDLHLESLRQLETQLGQTGSTGMGCSKPGSVPSDVTSDTLAADLLHMEIITGAFACDMTRVAAIQIGSDQSLAVNLPGLQGDEHTGFIHSGAPDFKNLIAFEAWLAGRFVDLVNALKARPDPAGGTLFDSTLVVWARDMGDADQHNQKSMRFVLAGGAGGYLKTLPGGRYIARAGATMSGATTTADRHERVLLSICDAMGVTDFKGFGASDLGANKSPLPGLAA